MAIQQKRQKVPPNAIDYTNFLSLLLFSMLLGKKILYAAIDNTNSPNSNLMANENYSSCVI